MSLAHLTRYRIYRSAKSRDYKCIVAATSRRDALRVARGHGLTFERTGYALEETEVSQ